MIINDYSLEKKVLLSLTTIKFENKWIIRIQVNKNWFDLCLTLFITFYKIIVNLIKIELVLPLKWLYSASSRWRLLWWRSRERIDWKKKYSGMYLNEFEKWMVKMITMCFGPTFGCHRNFSSWVGENCLRRRWA